VSTSSEKRFATSLADELSFAQGILAEALAIAQSRFRTLLKASVKDFTGDIVTDVDILCEEVIIRAIRKSFPDHTVVPEEAQDFYGRGPWAWIIDPLDGTNNYAYGFPLWGMSITLCHNKVPVLACIAEGATGTITTAICDGGVSVDGKPWHHIGAASEHTSAALWVGYKTDRNASETRQLIDILSTSTRRIFESWAPVVDVGLFLRGGIDVIIGKECSGNELPAALLVVREAGASVLDINGGNVELDRIPDLFIAGHDVVARRLASKLRRALA
jgi:myo-inositol-1(or 4)-monophosphatase